MSRFDEEPDGDIHGECAAEINSLKLVINAQEAEGNRLRARIAMLENALHKEVENAQQMHDNEEPDEDIESLKIVITVYETKLRELKILTNAMFAARDKERHLLGILKRAINMRDRKEGIAYGASYEKAEVAASEAERLLRVAIGELK